MARFQGSMGRLGMDVSFDQEELFKIIMALLRVEKNWIPSEEGQSMYIRPWAMSLTRSFELQAPKEFGIFCALSPVGAYFGPKIVPINIYIETRMDRGSQKSAMDHKLGSNYAPYVFSQRAITNAGWHNILWSANGIISEVNGCNMMFVVQNPNNVVNLFLLKKNRLKSSHRHWTDRFSLELPERQSWSF
jgi:branched-chain amino acid aminotransferase